jgi:hypothetical protein
MRARLGAAFLLLIVAMAVLPSGVGASSTPMKTLIRGRLTLSYPATWRAHALTLASLNGVSAIAVLGTNDAIADCEANGGTIDSCADRLRDGDIEISLGYPRFEFDPTSYLTSPSGDSTRLDIDGVPGVLTQGPPSAGEDLQITLAVGEPDRARTYVISGIAKGPDLAKARADMIHVLRSIRWAPPFVPLPTDRASQARIASRALTRLGPDYACFPGTPGHTATSSITRFPGSAPLRTAVRVVCTTSITALPIGVWRLDLVIRWAKASTYAAGSMTAQVWLFRNGAPARFGGRGGPPTA